MRHTSTICDKREHGLCDGTAIYCDQDGPSSRYICECHCHAARREERRVENAVAEVRKSIRTLRIDHLWELTPKASDRGQFGREVQS